MSKGNWGATDFSSSKIIKLQNYPLGPVTRSSNRKKSRLRPRSTPLTISVPLPQLIPQFLTPLRHVFFNTTLTSFDPVSSISNCKLNQPAELRDLGAVTTAVTSGPMTICFMRIDKFPGPAFKYPILLNANILVIKTYLLRKF
ncbi:hypothetical protein NQ317_015013 [Molorchus minor]|uniref:Uncharacterized protein n=1 Tax=Molorchus minor TaxID=1323400 RepID=A0ABQ9K599_9CUCU|nr:hypothetical protein NQ317_015013 [Molorchus minor]